MEDVSTGVKETPRRPGVKSRSNFNNYSIWKEKLRENCYKRVREDRTRLLWKLRLPASQSIDDEVYIKSAFQDIVSDELKKIKDSSLEDCVEMDAAKPSSSDELWEYDGLHSAYQGACEDMLLEMQRIFYEELRVEAGRKEPYNQIETWENEEDEYLARAVYENMQLNDKQVSKQTWCPICKQGELQENNQHIKCTLCNLHLNKDNEINLDILRDRLAEAHAEHFDRGCRLKPKFSVETRFSLTALYIFCEVCNTFEIII